MTVITLPYPPSVNHYYRRVGPRTLISRAGRRYRERVVAALAALKVPTMDGRLHLEIEFYPPDRRRRDIDNVQKALLDALQHGGLYEDDSQVVELRARKCDPLPNGAVFVYVEAASGD